MRSLLLVPLLALAACGGGADAPVQPTDGIVDVFTPGNKFSPSLVTVGVGGTVRFNITGVPHNVVFEKKAGAPADINVVDNVVVSRTFAVAGTFPFDCTVHPGMSGQVVVR